MGKLIIALWNANGLCQHAQELELFIKTHEIDILLISETHFTTKSYFRIRNYSTYSTNHPSGRARGGTAVIISNRLDHHPIQNYQTNELQATNIVIKENTGNLCISSVYCPPNENITSDDFTRFFKTLGNKFIAGGDYNAKHGEWGSRLTSPRGRSLCRAIQRDNLKTISTFQPTYWPTDLTKRPDLLDFCISKNVDLNRLSSKALLDLSSDHSPIIITLSNEILKVNKPPALTSRKTNWNYFREDLDRKLCHSISLKSKEEIEAAVEFLTTAIQQSAYDATPDSIQTQVKQQYPADILKLILEKRRARKCWQQHRLPEKKRLLNQLTRKLKATLKLYKNGLVHKYLSELTPTEATDYNLWKATKSLKQKQQINHPVKKPDGTWARTYEEKAENFATHLSHVFTPWEAVNQSSDDTEIDSFLEAPFQLDVPIPKFKFIEVTDMIKTKINTNKSPGFDLITGKLLHELPERAIRVLTYIFNAIIREKYYPILWKISEIIMIQKPGKNPDDTTSYRPISLLPILSKLLEKLILKRLNPILERYHIIPDYQFGFRNHHSTTEQVHRIVNKIVDDMNNKKYCTAAFLDISQAFDKVWHKGLLFKIKNQLPHHYYEIFKSYLENRFYYVKCQNSQSQTHKIHSGVPQGSVLGPILYLIYTADLPTSVDITTATFADDTAIIASHEDPDAASIILQANLNLLSSWLNKWKIKANELKSSHTTFTLRRKTCPQVFLNNNPIPQVKEVKYLGLTLDSKLTWQKHIFNKRKQLGLKVSSMYWLIGRKSHLSLENKILLYKSILKPIWTYGIQIWGTAAKSHTDIIQRFQNKVLRMIVDAPWYVTNETIQNDLNVPTIKDEITRYCQKYRCKIEAHPNQLAHNLMNINPRRRIKKRVPSDLH